MISDVPLWLRIREALVVDEVGIEAGRCNDYVLKTLYQPIFQNKRDRLVPWGVRGETVPYRNGRPVPLQAFFADVLPSKAAFVEGLSCVLQMRNHRNIGVEGLALLTHFDPGAVYDAAEVGGQAVGLLGLMEDAELPPELLVCQIADTVDLGTVQELTTVLRRHGVRVAVGQFGAEPSYLARARCAAPDLIGFDRAWFSRIAQIPAASRLLRSLVEALHREGREVLVEGIETPAQLRVALQAGADLLQGDLLRPAKLAGALLDTAPIDMARLLSKDKNVLPFFREGGSGRGGR